MSNLQTTKEKHEQKLLSCIDIPYFKNNPAYIDLWRSYYREFKEPQILFLMYHKQISTFFHWIHIEISQYFLKRGQPQLAHFIIEEAIHNKVFDTEKLKEALALLPPFVKKYSKGDMLAVLNIKNIKCLGTVWNSYIEEAYFDKNLPKEFCTFEHMKILEYEGKFCKNIVDQISSEETFKNDLILQDKEINSMKEEKRAKQSHCEQDESTNHNNRIEYDKADVVQSNEKENINSNEVNITKEANEDKAIFECEQSFTIDNQLQQVERECNSPLSSSLDGTSLEQRIIPAEDQILATNENLISLKESQSNLLTHETETQDDLSQVVESENQVTLTFDLPSENQLKKTKIFENCFSDMFDPSTSEIIGTLEHGSQLTIDNFVYFVQSVEKCGFSLLRIANVDDVTHTIIAKSFMLIKSDLKSIKIAKELFNYSLCSQGDEYFILYDFVPICRLDSFIDTCSISVKAFYLKKVIEKLINLKENFVMVSEPLNFFVDQDFDLGFGSFNVNQISIDSAVDSLKQIFGEFDISISIPFIASLQSNLASVEAKREIIKHKTILLQSL